ncbi:alpha/beta fold hydrolase [Sediminibacillus terrae]|uniref:alpha/beta fold hydrolase n=1 Tax=Sediminibacillus terrae TaxID=1562106 RepID=UPI001294C46A|nr:alpha/beta hydrolase [Sediminibacillus terrae]
MPYCYIENTAVHYQIRGHGIPVLMLHGFGPDSRLMSGCMEPIFERRDGYQRIYVDLPGMGRTRGRSGIGSADGFLKLILKFIDEVITEKPFLVAGESYGGYLARGLLECRQNQIKGAVFICPVIFPDKQKRTLPEKMHVSRDEVFLQSLDYEDRKAFVRENTVLDRQTWVRFREEVLAGLRMAEEDFLIEVRDNYRFTFPIDTMAFSEPCLFLLGKQDAVVGYKDAFKLDEIFPRSTFVVLDRAGHYLQIEQAQLFEVHMNEWLDRFEKI